MIVTEPLETISDLADLKQAFDRWRQDPNKLGRIPEALWEQVMTLVLSGRYPKSRVLITLGISGAQLSKRLAIAQQQENNPPNNTNFFKVTQPDTNESMKAATNPKSTHHDITITKPNGASLRIQQLPYTNMLQLANQFLESIS